MFFDWLGDSFSKNFFIIGENTKLNFLKVYIIKKSSNIREKTVSTYVDAGFETRRLKDLAVFPAFCYFQTHITQEFFVF